MWKRISLLLLLPVLLLSACAGKKISSGSGDSPPEVMGPVIPEENVETETVPPSEALPGEGYGPALPAEGELGETSTSVETSTSISTATSIDDGNESASQPPVDPKLCVVLGPGMAKAMAQAAVLASLKKAKLPVHCVVGVEMGAVVAALYSFSKGSTNNLQWQLFKLNKDTYFNFPMLSLRDPRSTGNRLHEFFEGLFKGIKIEDLSVPFATTAVDEERGSVYEWTRGSLADSLSASVAVPGIFDSWKTGSGKFQSAALTDPLPIELARKLGGNFIVAVDVLADAGSGGKSRYAKTFLPARSLMRLQRKEASFFVQVVTTQIQYDDFSRQGEILAAGTAATEKALPELRAAWERWSAGAR